MIEALKEIQPVPLPALGLVARVSCLRLHKLREGKKRTGHFEWTMDGRTQNGVGLFALTGKIMEASSAERLSGLRQKARSSARSSD